MGRTLVKMKRPIQNVDVCAEASLKLLKKVIHHKCKCLGRDGFFNCADLEDAFLGTCLVVFQKIIDGSVSFRVAAFLIPRILRFHMSAILLDVIRTLDLLEGVVWHFTICPATESA